MYDIFYRYYPYKLFLGKEGQTAVEGILKTFNILDTATNPANTIRRIKVNEEKLNDLLNITIEHGPEKTTMNVSERRKMVQVPCIIFQ